MGDFFKGIELTAEQKKLMISNCLRQWQDWNDWLAKCIPDGGWSKKYAAGYQISLVSICEELDPLHTYQNGKPETKFMLVGSIVDTKPTLLLGDWHSAPTELYLDDPEYTHERWED